eukprot:scaffold4039_cov124-Isochrysis_galbana.AAC.4
MFFKVFDALAGECDRDTLHSTVCLALPEKQNSASAWRGTMHNGASPAPAGANRGGLDRGQGCQARPRGQHRRELNTGTKIPPARQPGARPGLHRALLPSADHTCQSSGSRHGM